MILKRSIQRGCLYNCRRWKLLPEFRVLVLPCSVGTTFRPPSTTHLRFHSTASNNIGRSGALQTVTTWIQESVEKGEANIMVLCGAGVSVSANIPDFRTPGTGLYDNLDRYNLPYPEAIFDLDFFRGRPEAFLSLAKEIWPGGHSPTLTHSFLALLEQKNLLLRCYSQNIDGKFYLNLLIATIPFYLSEPEDVIDVDQSI